MAVGKNKGLSKGGKKGAKKKIVDPFTRKEWYDVKAPSMFKVRDIGKTLVNRTQGTKIASEGLKGRVFEMSVVDLQGDADPERAYRKFKLIAEDVQGKSVLTNFHGMTLTTAKISSMVKKWQTLVEASVDVKTTDGYLLRVFAIGCTQKNERSKKKAAYAQHTQVMAIRKIMVEKINKDVSQNDMKEVVAKLIADSYAKEVEIACRKVYPLHDVYIRKVKVLKKPRFDLSKLMDLHTGGDSVGMPGADGDTGERVDVADRYEPPVLEAV